MTKRGFIPSSSGLVQFIEREGASGLLSVCTSFSMKQQHRKVLYALRQHTLSYQETLRRCMGQPPGSWHGEDC